MHGMNIKNRFFLLVMAACICVSTEQVDAVNLSQVGKGVGVATVLTVAALVGVDIAFELQDVNNYYPAAKSNQQDMVCNNVESFMDQVKAGTVDHSVITINPLWLGYPGHIVDRRQARIEKLFAKAKEMEPCVIVMQESIMIPLLLPTIKTALATGAFLHEMKTLEKSGSLVVVDEALVEIMTEQLQQEKPDLSKNVLAKNVSKDEKHEYLHAKFKNVKMAESVDLPIIQAFSERIPTWGQLVKFVNVAQDFAAKDSPDALDFKHIFKAHRDDQSYAEILQGQAGVWWYGGLKWVSYHEAGHAILGMHTDTGASVLAMTTLPYQGSGGAVSYSELDKELTIAQKHNYIMMALAGGVVEQEFGFPKQQVFNNLDEAFLDFSERPNVFADLVMAYKMAIEIVGADAQFDSEQEKQVALTAIVKDVYGKTVEYIHEHRADVQGLAEKVLQKEILSAKEIRQILRLSDK